MSNNSNNALATDLTNSIMTSLIDSSVDSQEEYRPKLLVNDAKLGIKILNSLQDELKKCDEFAISVAFINWGGIVNLLDLFKELDKKGVKGRILTTNYLNFTEPKALKRLNEFENIEVKMFKTNRGSEGFHTKGYIFKKEEVFDIIVGSSNLTQSAITVNKEWNIRLVARSKGEYATKVVNEFDQLWDSDKALVYDEFFNEYSLEYEVAKKQRAIANENQIVKYEQLVLKPNKMQLKFIESLQDLILRGQKKALLISATGTGKTYASAFAMREIGVKKLLFIVHREQIAVQAKNSYEMVFGSKVKTGLVTGSIKDYDADLIFATKDTFTKEDNYKRFEKDHFDAIIIDEVHRLGEKTTYKRIFDYYIPRKIWLGMTASPERTDGFDIYNEFDHNIACEIRLKQALEEDLLCPFHYFGITDFIGNNNEIYDISDFNNLIMDKRVEYIVDKIIFYGYSGDRVKGLIFCSRIDEAKELSKKFNERGFKTAVLTGENNDENIRNEYIDRLTSNSRDDYLDYIFTVNVFNEGVDIPEINQVVMLRPTESPIIFIQQLGRGLRKNKDKEFVVVIDFIGNYNENFMIPIALSGDRSYNKDNLRKFVQQDLKFIPGSSTIQFDEISKQKIYNAIDVANFSDLKIIKNAYINLKNKIGKIPSLLDFDEYGEIDPLRIFDNKGSYYRFLVDVDGVDYKIRLTEDEEKYIEYVSLKLANAKRAHELIMLKLVLEYNSITIKDYVRTMKSDYNIEIEENDIRSVINVLSANFLTGTAKIGYEGCLFINNTQDKITLNDHFINALKNNDFKLMINELISFAIKRYERDYLDRYKNTSFVLNKKYSYEDVCRLLSWEKSIVAVNISGYKFDEKTNTYPIFINYEKEENISETIKYNDRLLNNEKIITLSTKSRTKKSKDVIRLINCDKTDTRVYLFLKKNKNDNGAKEFYFLGQIHPDGLCEEVLMSDNKTKAVEMGWRLENPIEESLYEYIIK